MRDSATRPTPVLTVADWKRLADEVADHGGGGILLRGGEPFLFPGIRELLDHIASRGLFISIDSNGTRLEPFADDLVRIGRVHLTVSVDGPEEIHDEVRGIPGSFRKLAQGVASIREAEKRQSKTIGVSLTFTISPWSYGGLGALPDVARTLGIQALCIVPYYFVPEHLGREYERELREELETPAFSWRGFHHETSGVDPDLFLERLRTYRQNLGTLTDFPYLPLTEDEYRTWFTDPVSPVRPPACTNVERLIDIQPTGEANFCVDFPDYSMGNVRESTIEKLWNGERALRFRERRREKLLSACHRCGARHMSEIGA
jgi:radical SAM protein with 4Fe4S-binding SPASM domain